MDDQDKLEEEVASAFLFVIIFLVVGIPAGVFVIALLFP